MRSLPGWIATLLRIPLPAKLVGANLSLLIVALAASLIARGREPGAMPVAAAIGAAFLLALIVDIALVALALKPVLVLEKTVDAVWKGDLSARVPASVLADRHVTRVGRMFNILLDGLLSDRARTRRLAGEIIHASDKERAALSRELHDSTAQSLVALVMQLSVAAHAVGTESPDILERRIEETQQLATNALEEVRLLAHTMYPRVLDDLGLIAALRRLARETGAHMQARHQGSATELTSSAPMPEVAVSAIDGRDSLLPSEIASVLYRVAQESVSNAMKHARPSRIDISLTISANTARIEVTDDGTGFDATSVPREHEGIGLFTMRERVALVDGTLNVTSYPGAGTSVTAEIPLNELSTLSLRSPK